MKSNKLYNAILFGLLLIVMLPLASYPPWLSPAPWGKTILFRSILIIISFLTLWYVLQRQSFPSVSSLTSRVRPFFLLLFSSGIFLTVSALSLLFSQDFHFSFWGTPERSWGVLTFLFYILFAALLILLIKQKDWKKIWGAVFLAGGLIAIIAIFQQFGQLSADEINRSFGTFGNPVLLGVYMVILTIMSLSFALNESQKRFKYVYAGLSLLFFLAIFFSASRAPLAGIGIGLIIFLLFYPKRNLLLKFAALLLILFSIGGILLLNAVPQISESMQTIPFLSNLSSRLALGSILDTSRILGWQIEWQGILDQPLLGYGPYNSYIGFNQHYGPPYTLLTDQLWDNAHNIFLDMASSIGLLGLAVYLFFIGHLLVQLQKLKRKGAVLAIKAHGIQSALIGYHVALLSFVNTFSTYLVFFLLIAYAIHLIVSSTQQNEKEHDINVITLPKLVHPKFILPVVFIAALWFIWSFNIQPLAVNKEIVLAKAHAEGNQCERALDIIDRVVPSSSYINSYAATEYVDLITVCAPQLPGQEKELSEKAVSLLADALRVRPPVATSWITFGGYTNNLLEAAQEDSDQTPPVHGLAGLAQEALEAFQRAKSLNPTHPGIFIGQSRTHELSGDNERALEDLHQCLLLNPEEQRCWLRQAQLYIVQEEPQKAVSSTHQAARATLEDSASEEQDFRNLVSIYAQLLGQLNDEAIHEHLFQIYQKLLEFDPANLQYRGSLAASYRELGEYEKARETALQILQIHPDAQEQVEEFLKSLHQP